VRFDRSALPLAMTSFLLIRHAHCDPVGHAIAGRTTGVHLSAAGQQQALALGQRLSQLQITGVYSSPLERALETAAPIAQRHGLGVAVEPGLTEIDFGEWTGRTLAELDVLPDWKAFNSFRSGSRIPGGESVAEVLARALAGLDRIRGDHPGSKELLAIVSHCDVLRAVIAHFLGVPTDLYQRIELTPASVSILVQEAYGPRLLLLNSTAEWPNGLGLRPKR
jgi:probable phosphomutase (TIGR03848 family)